MWGEDLILNEKSEQVKSLLLLKGVDNKYLKSLQNKKVIHVNEKL